MSGATGNFSFKWPNYSDPKLYQQNIHLTTVRVLNFIMQWQTTFSGTLNKFCQQRTKYQYLTHPIIA